MNDGQPRRQTAPDSFERNNTLLSSPYTTPQTSGDLPRSLSLYDAPGSEIRILYVPRRLPAREEPRTQNAAKGSLNRSTYECLVLTGTRSTD